MKKGNEYILDFLKGIAMGIGNIIPGVSGGTIALITGIYERFIHAFRSFDVKAVRMLLKGDIKGFIAHTDLWFLTSVFLGVLLSIIALARILGYTFEYYPVYTWAYFFGLILASVWYVGKTVERWNAGAVIFLLIGVAIAAGISLFSQATPNDNVWYLLLCGVVATCSMMLPGLSGSFVLVLMGNYELIFVDGVNTMNLQVLLPVAVGAVIGLIAFSRLLSWVLKNYRNVTIALLTGFVIGSLNLLWPWQKAVYNEAGDTILRYRKYIPDHWSAEVIWSMVFVLAGVLTIILLEYLAARKK